MSERKEVYWLLQIDAPGHEQGLGPNICAAAVWRKDAQGWRCVDAAPILSWMMKRSVAETKAYLEGKRRSAGWSWTWIKENGADGGI